MVSRRCEQILSRDRRAGGSQPGSFLSCCHLPAARPAALDSSSLFGLSVSRLLRPFRASATVLYSGRNNTNSEVFPFISTQAPKLRLPGGAFRSSLCALYECAALQPPGSSLLLSFYFLARPPAYEDVTGRKREKSREQGTCSGTANSLAARQPAPEMSRVASSSKMYSGQGLPVISSLNTCTHIPRRVLAKQALLGLATVPFFTGNTNLGIINFHISLGVPSSNNTIPVIIVTSRYTTNCSTIFWKIACAEGSAAFLPPPRCTLLL
ncbi:uncharacterized protein LOC128331335 [Hemicordylus capensis]|uniref:uncharacterized protein LOC128331335 n=1 Tax=Hemicordylus capensis TaxID=884348 RepID=UPI0023025BD1|nr:uncharacterized protein LOC128331335 [Hemicordylus capensis]